MRRSSRSRAVSSSCAPDTKITDGRRNRLAKQTARGTIPMHVSISRVRKVKQTMGWSSRFNIHATRASLAVRCNHCCTLVDIHYALSSRLAPLAVGGGGGASSLASVVARHAFRGTTPLKTGKRAKEKQRGSLVACQRVSLYSKLLSNAERARRNTGQVSGAWTNNNPGTITGLSMERCGYEDQKKKKKKRNTKSPRQKERIAGVGHHRYA